MTESREEQVLRIAQETDKYFENDNCASVNQDEWLLEFARRLDAEIVERCAAVAESVWDTGHAGAHGGEQANRTAAAIRQLLDAERRAQEEARSDSEVWRQAAGEYQDRMLIQQQRAESAEARVWEAKK